MSSTDVTYKHTVLSGGANQGAVWVVVRKCSECRALIETALDEDAHTEFHRRLEAR